MPRGNVLLVGLGGSGRRSSVKLAVSIADADLVQVAVTKAYTFTEWRDDMKSLLMKAGISGKTTVFLFCDVQAKEEAFIDDINALLNTADLPNLFQTEEKAIILEAMQTAAKQADRQIDTTPLALYGFFTERVRECLRIALAFSPIGDAFKNRLRAYPSLINCCTIDWFTTWPDDALIRVAETFISSMHLTVGTTTDSTNDTAGDTDGPAVQGEPVDGTEEDDGELLEIKLSPLEQSLVEMVMFFKSTVTEASERFFNELGRKNYVTPTSYLEMLRSLKLLYNRKYNEITMKRDRYTTGLEKLENAAGQVGEMQKKLIDFQPVLIKISDETEEIMIKIERETAEAEEKKEVITDH